MPNAIIGGGGFSSGFDSGFGSILETLILSASIKPISAILVGSGTSISISSTQQLHINDNNVLITISIPDWLNCSDLPNGWFQKDSKCAKRDQELYSSLLTNAYNNLGIPVEYYVSDFDTSFDKVFGDDQDRYVVRMFTVMAYYELPKEQNLWTQFGIQGLDLFHMYIAKEHMSFASTYSASTSSVFNSHVPRVGDIIRANYNNYYYEIVSVKSYEEQFLQTQHTWDLTVRPFRNLHLTLSASVSSENISAEIDKRDILTITSAVNIEKNKILYTPKIDEKPSQDPFSGW